MGSSILANWQTPQSSFSDATVFNVAVGGSTTGDWIDWLWSRVDPEVGDVLFYYCGSNDFNRGVAPSLIVENSLQILGEARERGMKLIYVPIIKSPQKRSVFQSIDEVNAGVLSGFGEDLAVFDWNLWLCEDEADVEGLYLDDDLHYTEQGYQRIAEGNAKYWQRYRSTIEA